MKNYDNPFFQNQFNNNNDELEEKEYRIKSLEKELKEKNKKIKELQTQNDRQKKEINQLKKENDDFSLKFAVLESELESKKSEIKKLVNENKKCEYELNLIKKESNQKIERLERDKEGLSIAINRDFETIRNLNKFGIGINSSDNIKVDPITNQLKGSVYIKDTKFTDFYDVIIDIKSVKDIKEGWRIKMSEKGHKKYKEFKETKILKIGVIGNSNKGKSFLLSKISKIKLPSGTSIRTEGLSIKYPELEGFKGRKIALLDSAGLETPVLKSKEDDKLKNNEKDLFKEKSREKLITELFLQNYIINNSDILIVVVGILTYSEQKLLNRIKTEIKKAKLKKTLFIIHNLITYTEIEQVEDYIKQYLLESATFHLEQGHNISTNTQTIEGKYYFETKSDPKIYHLIFANEDSKAGNYYNKYTLNFLEHTYQGITDLNPFDVIQTVKERFVEISKEIIEKTDNQILDINSFEVFDNNEKPECIKLKVAKDITLKKCLIDELGFSNLKANGFEPTYNYYKDVNEQGVEKIIIKVEAPGNSSIGYNIIYSDIYTIIRLKGYKKKDKFPAKIEDNIHNTRELGEFSVDIPLKTEEYLLKVDEKPKIYDIKGLLVLEFLLQKKISFDNNDYQPDEEI